MEASYLTRHPRIKDILNFIGFVLLVLIGTLLINTYVFRSFSVSGHSMDHTLADGDRLIVDRLPVTAALLKNKPYVPNRGQIIVFKNPRFLAGMHDEFIVKRVIAFPGERVTVKDGTLTVYNREHPNGFHPDDEYRRARQAATSTQPYPKAYCSSLATTVSAAVRTTRVPDLALFPTTTLSDQFRCVSFLSQK